MGSTLWATADRAPQAADLPAEGQQLRARRLPTSPQPAIKADTSDIQNSYSKGTGYSVLTINGYTKAKKQSITFVNKNYLQ
jgi:hypothetical protein